MLNLTLGDPTRVGVRDGIATHLGRRGHALFGPYEQRGPGRFVVEFELELQPAAVPLAGDGICAVVDVVKDGGQTDVAMEYVLRSELAGGAVVRLEFDLHAPAVVEYRVWVNGEVPISIADEPVVRERSGTAPARSRLSWAGEIGLTTRAVRNLVEAGIMVDAAGGRLSIPVEQLSDFAAVMAKAETDRSVQAHHVVEAVGWRGDEENSLYRAFVGQERPFASPPQPVPFGSTLCHQAHFALDQYRYWARAMKQTPRFQRKQWEFVYIAQALFERGMLASGRKGLVFGAGQEPLPALFASWGVEVLATDQAPESAVQGGWIASGQHTYDLSALNKHSICTDRMFSELVRYRSVDMNDVPADLDDQFDFCWSACALEHLGSLEHGFRFIEASLRTLRPGGVAVHTTEYNLSSNDDTVESLNLSLYRQRDIEAFVTRLERQGYVVAPIDWELGEGYAETVIDLPPFGRGEPHIRLMSGVYETTSIGLIITRPS